MFKYAKPDYKVLDEKVRELQESSEKTNESTQINFYIKNGITQIRILPAHPDHPDGLFYRETVDYFLNGRPYTAAEGDVVSQFRRNLFSTKEDEAVEFAREKLRPRTAFLVNAIVQSAPPATPFMPGQVHVVSLPKTVFEPILTLDRDEATGMNDVTGVDHAENGEGFAGISFRITRTGKGKNDTKYQANPVIPRTTLESVLESFGKSIDDLDLINLYELYPAPDRAVLIAAIRDIPTPDDIAKHWPAEVANFVI